MNLRLITPPSVEPVDLPTAKTFLRVDISTDDALITSLAKAARERGEEISRRAFITQTWEMVLDGWPDNSTLKILRPPLQSVTSVKYLDKDSVEQTWTDYIIDIRNEPGVIVFKSLPSVNLLQSGAIMVRFVSGYGATAADVPERIKNAVLALTAHWYENREVGIVPVEIRAAFTAERTVWFR